MVKNLERIDFFARNKAGETSMDIARAKGWNAGVEFLDVMAKQNDKTSKIAESIFEELDAEEKKKSAARDKKRRQTLRKAAEKRGITVDELERLNADAAENEKKAEIKKEKDAVQAEIDAVKNRKLAYEEILEQERLDLEAEKEAEKEAFREVQREKALLRAQENMARAERAKKQAEV